MKKVLAIGRNGACVVVCDTPSKFEVVSCWNYNEEKQCWGQGHYFTEWYPTSEEQKQRVIEDALNHFKENYL